MTQDTLALISDLLAQVQINVGHPDFETQAHRLIAAKREVAALVAASD